MEYPNALVTGTVLNTQYEIKRVLGQGGFGITYLAIDIELDIEVAIKEYYPEGMVTRNYTNQQVTVYNREKMDEYRYGEERFLEEARVLAKLQNNAHVIGIKNFFRENGTAYFVMDYVKGISFKAYLESMNGRILYQDALALLVPIMDALKEVHALGLLHRDISPDNIYITNEGKSKLLDFGSARGVVGEKSKSLSVILKPGYAPEEQYRSKGKQGPWTDVYALAATLYIAITGQLPPESLDRLDQDELMMPNALGIQIPIKIENAIKKALAIKACNRYQIIEEFKLALLSDEDLKSTAYNETENNNDSKKITYKKQMSGFNKIIIYMGIVLASILIVLLCLKVAKLYRVDGENSKRTHQLNTANIQTEEVEDINVEVEKDKTDLKDDSLTVTKDKSVETMENSMAKKELAEKEIQNIALESHLSYRLEDSTGNKYRIYVYGEIEGEERVDSESKLLQIGRGKIGDRIVEGRFKIAYFKEEGEEVKYYDIQENLAQEGDSLIRINISENLNAVIKDTKEGGDSLKLITLYRNSEDKYCIYTISDEQLIAVDAGIRSLQEDLTAEVTIHNYRSELPTTARTDNIFVGTNPGEYSEVGIKGKIYDLKLVTIDMDKLLENNPMVDSRELIEEIIIEFGEVSNDTLIIDSYSTEGIPREALMWTWPSGKQEVYYINEKAFSEPTVIRSE